MSQITKPLFLNETGQSIVTALGAIASAVQPTNIYEDLSVSLPVNGWTNEAPFTYTWTSNKVTPECGVEVGFEAGAKTTGIMLLSYEKVAGGVQFTAPSKPDAAIPVTIRIINADSEYVIDSIDAEMVSTNAVPGTSNVEEALGELNSKIAYTDYSSGVSINAPTLFEKRNIYAISNSSIKRLKIDVKTLNTISTGAWTNLVTLPAEMTPSTEIRKAIYVNLDFGVAWLQIQTTGQVRIYVSQNITSNKDVFIDEVYT